MLKKITSFWKKITIDDNIYQISKEDIDEGRLFIDSLFDNDEYSAMARANKSNSTKYQITSSQIEWVKNKFLHDIKNEDLTTQNFQFFIINPKLMDNNLIVPLFQSYLSEKVVVDLLRHHILSKNSELLNTKKFNSHDFKNKEVYEFFENKFKDPEAIQLLKQSFNSYLKNGSSHANEEYLYCLAAKQLAPFFSMTDIQESSYASNRVNRTFFSEYRQQINSDSSSPQVTKPVVEKKETPAFKLSDITPNTLPSILDGKYNEILTLVKKFEKSKITHDPEDSHFLESLMSRHLPETLSQYLQIDPSYRDKKVTKNSQTATEITGETLDLYLKRLDRVNQNLSYTALQKLQANKLLIQRMSNNINLYNQGITDVPDDLEIQAPEVTPRKVTLRP